MRLALKFQKGNLAQNLFSTVEMKALKETTERDQEVIAKLHQSHADEVSNITKQARMQLQNERERLLNQIRELTAMKAHATAEV